MNLYKNNGPVDCTVDIDTGSLGGKVVVVTGGELAETSAREHDPAE
jgi:hypothetical protein